MEPEDPFGWITKNCKGSFSEDSSMRRCSYFGQLDSDISGSDSGRKDPTDDLLASTGITMVSLDSDGDAGSGRVVDLGRDTDLVFSEAEVRVESRQRSEADSTPKGADREEPEVMVVPKRGFCPKIWVMKSLKRLGSESRRVRLRNTEEEQTGSELELEDQQNNESKAEVGEGSVREKKVDFSTGEINIESRDDSGEGDSDRNKKSVENGGGDGSNMGGDEIQKKTERKRKLPSWLHGGEGYKGTVEVNVRGPVQTESDSDGMSEDFKEIADGELDGESEDFEEPTLLDVLVELEEDHEEDREEDRSLECLSLLEVAQREWGEDFMAKNRSQEGPKGKR